jgi:hypothetical protein
MPITATCTLLARSVLYCAGYRAGWVGRGRDKWPKVNAIMLLIGAGIIFRKPKQCSSSRLLLEPPGAVSLPRAFPVNPVPCGVLLVKLPCGKFKKKKLPCGAFWLLSGTTLSLALFRYQIHLQIPLYKKKISHHIKISVHIYSTKCRWNQKLIARFCCPLRDECFKPN